MFQVMYKGKIHIVYNVQRKYNENYDWPIDTWFLISTYNSFMWVESKECKPVV